MVIVKDPLIVVIDGLADYFRMTTAQVVSLDLDVIRAVTLENVITDKEVFAYTL